MKLHKMTSEELNNYRQYCIQTGNTSALAEINDFEKYYGNVVEITGGNEELFRMKAVVESLEKPISIVNGSIKDLDAYV